MLALRLLLPVLVLSLAGCIGTGSFRSLVAVPAPSSDPSSEGLERIALDHVNAARAAAGLAPMRVDPVLSRAARSHAHDMYRRGYYAHVSPSGVGVQQRHDRAGGPEWRLVAENIARCSRCAEPPEAAEIATYHERWMASAGHRANILAPELDAFGFGVAHGDDGTYLVQKFSGPGLPNGLRRGDSLRPLSPEEQAGKALELVNAARARAGVAPLAPSPVLARAVREVMPRRGARHFEASVGAVQRAVPAREREQWRGIAGVHGACNGCGGEPDAADVRYFVSDWLERPNTRSVLLDSGATQFGFAVAANGEGRKVALIALGRGH